MASVSSLRLKCEPLRFLAFGSIGVPYAGVGTAIEHPARMLLIQNLTDALLMFSFDGINDHFPLSANDKFVLDIATNKSMVHGFYLAEGQRLYVRQVLAPSSGSVAFTVFYGAE